jgi:hypothetical protein
MNKVDTETNPGTKGLVFGEFGCLECCWDILESNQPVCVYAFEEDEGFGHGLFDGFVFTIAVVLAHVGNFFGAFVWERRIIGFPVCVEVKCISVVFRRVFIVVFAFREVYLGLSVFLVLL